jgi:hypothetical protein
VTDLRQFAERIRQRFPEGLTAAISLGGTRTTYILMHNRHKPDPGRIENFRHYADYLADLYLQVASHYYDMGGQNLIYGALSFQSFYVRGQDYTQAISKHTLLLIGEQYVNYYLEHQVDPYFVGIDTLLNLPGDNPAHALGQALKEFQQQWHYQEGRRKMLWEIAPIPLYSFWRWQRTLKPEALGEIDSALAAASDLPTMYEELYRRFAEVAYGTYIPLPHFCVGTNRQGAIKLRPVVPGALLNGGATRFFYTPYPSGLMSRETMQRIIEDVAWGKTINAKQIDLSGEYTSAMAQAEYERIQRLLNDPGSVAGMLRHMDNESDASDE